MLALVIIYNHKYDKNIPKIENLYKDRFSHIYHLVPFYTGEQNNVIPVYENSYYFQGYVAQAHQLLKSKGNFDHYLFIGDDLIINPLINEDNYKLHFNIDNRSAFFPKLQELINANGAWKRVNESYEFTQLENISDLYNKLPNYEDAINRFSNQGLYQPTILKGKSLFLLPLRVHYPRGIRGYWKYWKDKSKIKKLRVQEEYQLSYPIVGGYSDIIIIPQVHFDTFCRYCGFFAVYKLFVELAIPTSMVLACDKISQEKDLKMKGVTYWTYEEFQAFENKYDTSIDKLLDSFPNDVLYFHPVKLSKWIKG